MKALRIWLPLLTLVSACGYFNSTGPNAENVPANSALSFGALPDVQLIDATGREVSPARLKGSAWALALLSRPLRNQSRTLTKALGDDTDDWIGKQVILYVDPDIEFGGNVVGGLRVKQFRNAASPKRATVEDVNRKLDAAATKDPLDDIPFN